MIFDSFSMQKSNSLFKKMTQKQNSAFCFDTRVPDPKQKKKKRAAYKFTSSIRYETKKP